LAAPTVCRTVRGVSATEAELKTACTVTLAFLVTLCSFYFLINKFRHQILAATWIFRIFVTVQRRKRRFLLFTAFF
jgi:hypothetical protein